MQNIMWVSSKYTVFCLLLISGSITLTNYDDDDTVDARKISDTFAQQPAWDDKLDLSALEKQLSSQNIAYLTELTQYIPKAKRSSHILYMATMQNGIKAVFKPKKQLYGPVAEIAAYKACQWMGFRFVPPTVLKKYDALQGSLQFFVKHSSSKNIKLSAQEQSDIQLFCFVFGKTDTNADNKILFKDINKNYVVLIDNESMRHIHQVRYGDFAFIYRGSRTRLDFKNVHASFPFDQERTVVPNKFSRSQLVEMFGSYFSPKRIERLARKTNPMIYCIWNNSVWVKEKQKEGPSYTKIFNKSTIERLKQLDRKTLEYIWAEGLNVNKKYFDVIIDLTLERRDQVLQAASKREKEIERGIE